MLLMFESCGGEVGNVCWVMYMQYMASKAYVLLPMPLLMVTVRSCAAALRPAHPPALLPGHPHRRHHRPLRPGKCSIQGRRLTIPDPHAVMFYGLARYGPYVG